MSYDNNNKGQIWKNDKKVTEHHPDFRGSLNVEGVEYWVSGWKRKEGGNPKAPALSFKINKKEESFVSPSTGNVPYQAQATTNVQGAAAPPSSNPPVVTDEFDEDIPFS